MGFGICIVLHLSLSSYFTVEKPKLESTDSWFVIGSYETKMLKLQSNEKTLGSESEMGEWSTFIQF